MSIPANKTYELVYDDQIYTVKLVRTSSGVYDVEVAGVGLVGVGRHIRQGWWRVTSKMTNKQHGGHVLQTTVTQLFYEEVARWLAD